MITLPDVPACWEWDLPPLPQPSTSTALLRWQGHRCAICAAHMPGRSEHTTQLYEDHDHATGDVRGYLCPRCNTAEGYSNHSVFLRYRERHPAAILGVLARKCAGTHPQLREAQVLWQQAIGTVEELIRGEEKYQTRRRVADTMRAQGHPTYPQPFRIRRAVSPLVRAALRGGYRIDEARRMRERDIIEYPDLIPLALAQVLPESGDLMRGVEFPQLAVAGSS